MVRVTALTSPLLLGFDDLERALDKVSKTGTDGYPPYNIERIAAEDGAPERSEHGAGAESTFGASGVSRGDRAPPPRRPVQNEE